MSWWNSPDDIPEIGDDDSGSKGKRATGEDTRKITGVSCEHCLCWDGNHVKGCRKLS